MGDPKLPTPIMTPPAPTPAMLQPPKLNAAPTLGNTYLTSGVSMAKPTTKPAKTLFGQ